MATQQNSEQPKQSPEQPKNQEASQKNVQSSGQGGSFINPVNINIKTGDETDWATILIILAAYAIWLFDSSSYSGGPYRGFAFTSLLLLNTNWIAVFTSGIVSAFLIWNIFGGLFNKDSGFVVSFILLAVINSSMSQTLSNWSTSIPYLNVALLILFAGVAFYFLRKEGYNFAGSELFTYILMVLIFSFFWVNWSWTANIKAIIHIIFITTFCLIYLASNKKVEKSRLYLLTSLFLIADFFLYSIDFGNSLVAYFPILVLITSYYCNMFTESYAAKVNSVLLTLFLVIIILFSPPGSAYDGGVPLEKKEGEGKEGFIKAISDFFGGVKSRIEGNLEYATGGLYRSQVEKNQFEPLGVFFDRVRAAQPRFYADEDTTLWATLKSRTLSDPVMVNFTCFRWKDGKRIRAEKDDTIIPNKPFTVYTLEDKDVECTFKSNKLQSGSSTITLSTTYNFITSAYQKVYFIDKDRQRAMVKEGLDPLKEFGITDKAPATVYTNGPVELAVDMQHLTAVADNGDAQALGVLIRNRDKITDKQGNPTGEWQGKIKKINELVILLPKGIGIDAENCKPVRFKKYYEEDCENSCRDIVFMPCADTCSSLKEGVEKDKCLLECSDASQKCTGECADIFKGDSENSNYEGYQLDIEELEKIKKDEYKDIDKFKIFICRIAPRKEVLENSPITTKFVRVRARYDYLVEKSYNIIVEQPPIPVVALSIEDSIRNSVGKSDYDLNQFHVTQDITAPLSDFKGLIYLESGFKHCCLESGKNKPDDCKPTDDSRCNEDKILTSYDNANVGIMQINKADSSLANSVCVGQTIYDRECNMKVGLKLLETAYKKYKDGAGQEILKTYCPKEGLPDSASFYEIYRNYKGWDAALRSYNGWGCRVNTFIKPKCTQFCIRVQDVQDRENCVNNCINNIIGYVEKVKDKGKGIKEAFYESGFINSVPKNEGAISAKG